MQVSIVTAIIALVGLVIGPSPSTDVETLAAKFELTRKSDAATGRETIQGPGFSMTVAPGMSVALVNGQVVPLKEPARIAAGRLVLPGELVAIIEKQAHPRGIAAKMPVRPGTRRVNRDFKIVIDPGHGGMHTGGKSKSGRLIEKDVTLDVSLRLRKILQDMGVEVVMTRTTDVHFSEDVDDDLMHRIAVSNKARPDFFLSIHSNWHPGQDARGFEVYVGRHLEGVRENGRIMASEIRSLFKSSLDTEDRGIKEAGFKVIKLTDAPSALVELEFISNPAGERELGDALHRQKLADLMGEAVWRYVTRR